MISDGKSINFTDKKGIGRLKPKETRDLHFYSNSTLVGEILLLLAGW
jgi:putative transposase